MLHRPIVKALRAYFAANKMQFHRAYTAKRKGSQFVHGSQIKFFGFRELCSSQVASLQAAFPACKFTVITKPTLYGPIYSISVYNAPK